MKSRGVVMKIMVARLPIRFYCSPSRLKLEYFHQVLEAMTLARMLLQKNGAAGQQHSAVSLKGGFEGT